MKGLALKLLEIAAVIGVAAVVMRFAGPKLGERMERMFEQAPEDFPPKWMFVNITAIRDNTERILEALQQTPQQTSSDVA